MATLRNIFVFLAYVLLCSVLMSAFILMQGIFRYAFSLGALLIGIRFFKTHETIGSRIGFIAVVVVFTLIMPSIYVLIAYANGWPINPVYLKGITE